MPDSAHPISPRGLSPITELTTPRSLQPTLPNDEPDHPHPSYASIREGGSDRSSVYSQASAGSGGTITPRARRVSLPRGFELGPPLSRVPEPTLAPRDGGLVDSPSNLPPVSPFRRSQGKPFPSPSLQPGGLPPPPRRRGTPPPTSPTRIAMTRPHSWQPRSRSDSGPIEEGSESHHSDPSAHYETTAGQAGIGAGPNFEATIEEDIRFETLAEVLSPASTLLARRPSLRLSHSSPAISRGIEPTPSPPVPHVELLSQTLKASPYATPPISPAGSTKGSKSANLLRKRAKSMNGKKTSPKTQGSNERPLSVLGTSSVRAGSSSTLGKRQPTPPRRESSLTPPALTSRPSSHTGSFTNPSTRTRKGSKRTARKSIVSSLFSIFDPSSRHRTSQPSLSKSPSGQVAYASTGSEELLGVEPQTAIRTSGTFGVRDDGSVLEDPNKSPRSLVHSRTRTESGPALSALSAATSGFSGNGSAKSMGAGRVLYVQNLAGRASEEKYDAHASMEKVTDTVTVPQGQPIPIVSPAELPAITSSPEQTATADEPDLTLSSDLPRPSRARRDISKGSSTSDHTFGDPSPGQSNPSPERRESIQSHTPPPVLLLNPGSVLTSLEPSQAGQSGSRPRSTRASPTRPLPRPPSSSPRATQASSIELLDADVPHDEPGSVRPLSIISNQGSDSITPRASQIPQDSQLRGSLLIPGPTLNIPAPPSVSPGASRESSWYAPAPDVVAMLPESSSVPSDQAEAASPAEDRRQVGSDEGQTFQADYLSPGDDQPPRHPSAQSGHSHRPQHSAYPRQPHIPCLNSTSGSTADIPFLIASHVLSTHAAQLMQQSTDMHEISEAIRRMAKESLDWGGMLMRLSEESRTGRPAPARRRQRPVSMPQAFPPGLENLRELLERMRMGDHPPPPVPPVPDIPEPYRSSSRPAPPPPPPVPPGAYDPLYDAWLRLHGQRPPTVHDPFVGFPDYRPLSAYHHPYASPRLPPADHPHPMYYSYRPDVRDDTTHPHTPGARVPRQRRTQSLEYPLEWVQEADRLGMEGWSSLHHAEEAWHIAMGFLRRVVEEGHDLATPGRARPHPATTDPEPSTGGRGWRYHPRSSGPVPDEYDRPESRTSRVSRGPSPTPKIGSTRASTPSRYGPEGFEPPPPLPPFSPILESSESAHRHSLFSRRGEYEEGRQRETSFLPRAEDMVSMPRSHSPSFRRSEIKARRVLGADETPGARSQSYTFPVPRLRPDLGMPHSHSVGPGVHPVVMPLTEATSGDFGADMGRPTHGRQRSQGPTSTIGSKGTARRKLRKGVKRTATGGTLRNMGSGTMRSGRPPTPTLERTVRRGTPTRTRRHGSGSSTGSRGSRSGSEGGHRARPPSRQRKRHWWNRRK